MRNPEDQLDLRQLANRHLLEVRSNPTIPFVAEREFSGYAQEDKALLAMREEISRLRQENVSLRRKQFKPRRRYDAEGEEHLVGVDQDESLSSNVFTDNGDKKTVLNNKYNKALREITKLLKINRQLKTELNASRGRDGGSQTSSTRQLHMQQECDDLRFKVQALEEQLRELQSTNNLYSGQLTEYEIKIQEIKMHYEEQIRKLMGEYEQRIVELRSKFESIEEEMSQPNQVVFDLKVSLERYKKQEVVWHEEKRSFYDQILRLQNSLEQSRLEKEKLQEDANAHTEKLNSKFKRELQEEIFEYKSENNNLRQSLELLTLENDRLNRELKFSLSTRAEKHQDESKVIWELNCQIENFISEIGGLRGAIQGKEQAEAELQILQQEHENLVHSYKILAAKNEHLQKCLTEQEAINISRSADPSKLAPKPVVEVEKKPHVSEELEHLKAEVEHLRGENHLLYNEIEEIQQKFKEDFQQNSIPIESGELPSNPRILFLQGKLKEFRFRIDLIQSMKSRDNDMQKEAGMMKIILGEITNSLGVIISDNNQMRTKLQRYREKTALYKQRLSGSSKDNKKLMEKVRSYDRLVVKYEKELESLMFKEGLKVQKKEKKTFRLSDLEEKLEIQEKGFEQELQTKVLEYEAKLIQKKIEIERLKEEANSFELYKGKIKEMADKIMELESLNGQYWSRLNKAPFEQNESHSKSAGSQNSEIVALIEKVTEKDNKIITLQFKVSKLADLLSHAETRNKDLELSMESGVEDYNQLRAKCTEMQMANDSLRQELSLCEIKLRNTENLKSMRVSIAEPTDNYVSIRENEIAELKVILKKLTEDNQHLEHELSSAKRTLIERQEELRRLQEDSVQTKSRLEEANYRIEKFKKEQIELTTALSSEKQNSEHREVQYRANVTDLKSRCEAAEAEVSRLRQSESQMLNHKYEASGLKTQCGRLQDRILMLESQLMHFNDITSKQATQVSKNYEKDFELELELHSLRQAKERHDRTEQNLTNELHEVNKNFAQERKQLLEEINGLRSELIRVETHKRELEYQTQGSATSQIAKLNQALQNNSRLEEQILVLKKRFGDLEREKKVESDKASALESERYRLMLLPAELERLQHQIQSRDEEIASVNTRLNEKQSRIHQLENELFEQQQVNTRTQQLQEKVQTWAIQYKFLFSEIERLTKMKEELEQDLRELRLRYTGDNYHEQRLKQNLGLFVLLFAEIESLRGQLCSKTQELEVSRRSSIAIAAKPVEDIRSASPFHQHRMSDPIASVTDSPSKLHEFGSSTPYRLPPIVQASYTSESRILAGEQVVGLEFRKSRSRSKNAKSPERKVY